MLLVPIRGCSDDEKMEVQTIVLVEDDGGMRTAMERLLRAAGYRALTFASAEALLQTDAVESASCLVLDVHLPGLSGFELRRRLAGSGCKSPAIFITAHDDASARDEAREVGCAAYFRKPFDGSALLAAIRRATLPRENADDE